MIKQYGFQQNAITSTFKRKQTIGVIPLHFALFFTILVLETVKGVLKDATKHCYIKVFTDF